MPMLVLSGEKAGGTFLIEQAKLVASNVRGQVVAGTGHWLIGGSARCGDPGPQGLRGLKSYFSDARRAFAARRSAVPNPSENRA